MKLAKVQRAKHEARRFLDTVYDLEQRINSGNETTNRVMMFGCQETAAVRRASLDLTRALARMRSAE